MNIQKKEEGNIDSILEDFRTILEWSTNGFKLTKDENRENRFDLFIIQNSRTGKSQFTIKRKEFLYLYCVR